MATDRLLVTAREAARMLGVSPRTLWGLTFEARQPLPYVRVGRLVRYRPDQLSAWLDQRQARGGVR